ncbi:MAG: hypothetical protein AAF843_10440 [Bacteroidota bacterium]
MRSLFCPIVLLCLVGRSLAQEKIVLRAVPFDTKAAIHIADVFDDREEQHLGVHKNLTGEEVNLALYRGAVDAVKEFYSLSVPYNENSKPIYIRIRALNVQESKRRMNQGIARVARAHVELAFQEKVEKGFKTIFTIQHNEDQVFGLVDKAGLYATHEKRIRAALEYCMLAFLDSYDSVNSKDKVTTVQHFSVPKDGRKVDVRLGEWRNLLTVKGMRSRYFEGYAISYTGFVDSKKGLIRPYETSFEVTWARSGIAEENGFQEVNSYVFRPELYFIYKRLTRGIYASMSANVPLGYEILEDFEGDNSFNFVVGVGASQGIRFIPWQKRGIVFGVDFFQQFETSEVYRTDFGAEIVIGVNF